MNTYQQYKRQSIIVKDLKNTWRKLIKNKAPQKQRSVAKEEIQQAVKVLDEIKSQLKNEREQKKVAKNVKEKIKIAISTGPKRSVTKDIQSVCPLHSTLTISLLPGYTLAPNPPRVYTGRYVKGMPISSKSRYGFLMEFATKKEYTQEEIRQMAQEYFNANALFFGNVIHVTFVMKSLKPEKKNIWHVNATTDKKDIIGFLKINEESYRNEEEEGAHVGDI